MYKIKKVREAISSKFSEIKSTLLETKKSIQYTEIEPLTIVSDPIAEIAIQACKSMLYTSEEAKPLLKEKENVANQHGTLFFKDVKGHSEKCEKGCCYGTFDTESTTHSQEFVSYNKT
jgi:hypothetical protein